MLLFIWAAAMHCLQPYFHFVLCVTALPGGLQPGDEEHLNSNCSPSVSLTFLFRSAWHLQVHCFSHFVSMYIR